MFALPAELFIESLPTKEDELDAINILEILWLAENLKTDRHFESKQISQKPEDKKNDTDAIAEETSKSPSSPPPPPPPVHEASKYEIACPEKKEKNQALSTQKDNPSNQPEIIISHEGYFPNAKKINAYLLEFNDRTYSKKRDRLDETKTVDFIANTSLAVPFFQRKKQRVYTLYLFVDKSSSMEVWQEMIQAYKNILFSSGVFKETKEIYVDTNDKSAKFYHDKNLNYPFFPSSLYAKTKDKIAVFLSDMNSRSWKNGDVLHRLEKLYTYMPLFAVQMLPYRLWQSTVLKQASITTLHSRKKFPTKGSFSSEIDALYKSLGIKTKDLVKLPIVHFDLESLQTIGRVIKAKKQNRIDGALINLHEINFEQTDEKYEKLSSKEKIDRFFANSTPKAQQLAISLSAVPLNLPVMRMIQKKVLDTSQNIYLAEVLNSGLLKKEDDFYIYKDDIQDILLTYLGRQKALDILYKNSEYIENNIGAKFSFKALLSGEIDLEDINFDEDAYKSSKIFAMISCKVLKSLGKEYAQKAGCGSIESKKCILPTSKRFQMGSNDGYGSEQPVHEVIINYDFEIAKYPVTFEEYDLFCEDTGREKPDDEGWGRGRRPVINVSWHDAKAYCEWLSKKTGETYRLPTEAEWEYACRAGTTTEWSFGDDGKELEKYAWYDENSDGKTHPVGEKLPNPWGLYDMYGNVREWCEDDWAYNYKETPRDGSANYNQKEDRKVLRGGSWGGDASYTRSAYRYWYDPDVRYSHLGFRLLRTLPS